jgi:hypothetical protein
MGGGEERARTHAPSCPPRNENRQVGSRGQVVVGSGSSKGARPGPPKPRAQPGLESLPVSARTSRPATPAACGHCFPILANNSHAIKVSTSCEFLLLPCYGVRVLWIPTCAMIGEQREKWGGENVSSPCTHNVSTHERWQMQRRTLVPPF